jgi:conjugal transfer pilus assembly protein TraU
MMSLGGVKMGESTLDHGSVGHPNKAHMKQSFYHVHWYIYPLIYWLELLTDFACLEKAEMDVGYMTELDPLWGDDETNFILNPEAALFGNPAAQMACAADCAATSIGFPRDELFWCGGCQGSLYPFTGSVAAHSGGIQSSLLIVQRFIAKLHREGLLWGYAGSEALCGKYPMPLIRKTQYKIQMTFPQALHCHPLGRSDLLWSQGVSVPETGEDFSYFIWRKRQCCLL